MPRATRSRTRTRLKIDKSLTLKGAGADLVTISPRRYDGNDGVIAEDPQNIRYPSGNILTAVGTPAVPITVDISGVTFDGNAVAAKAGVVFLDAQGSLRRSRVTDIVTSESPGAYDMPGGYRSSYLGYGVAQVTAALTAPLGAGPRTLTIANTRIDEYNRAGVLIDGGTDAASPVTPSGVDLRGRRLDLADRGALPVLGLQRRRRLRRPAAPGQPRAAADRRRPPVRPGRHPPRWRARAARSAARS